MIPDVNPAEAARRARWFRKYAAIAQSPEDREDRTAKAEAYQRLAVAGGAETGKNADDGVDW